MYFVVTSLVPEGDLLTHSFRTSLVNGITEEIRKNAYTILDVSHITGLREIDHLGGIHFVVNDNTIETRGVNPFGDERFQTQPGNEWIQELHKNGIAGTIELLLLLQFIKKNRKVTRGDRVSEARMHQLNSRGIPVEGASLGEHIQGLSNGPTRKFNVIHLKQTFRLEGKKNGG